MGRDLWLNKIRKCNAFPCSLLEINKAHQYIKGSEKYCSEKNDFASLT